MAEVMSFDQEYQPLVLFDASKGEKHTPEEGLRILQRRLRSLGFLVETNHEDISVDVVSQAKIFVLCGPTQKFTSAEFNVLREFVRGGGSVLIQSPPSGSTDLTNTNYLTEEFGIIVNSDAVVRAVYRSSYHHPEEVCVSVSGGIVNRELRPRKNDDSESDIRDDAFVFPFGSTLNVIKPAVPLLSSGYVSYPVNRPLAAVAGSLCVIGSCDIFSDEYLKKELNEGLAERIFELLRGRIVLNKVDEANPEINDYHYLPDIEAIAENVQSCLHDGTRQVQDDPFQALFDDEMYGLSMNLVPESTQLYSDIGLDHKPLTLIPPEFDVPLPSMKPAAFPPPMRDLPPPALDLFDLDEQFASEHLRLAQLANKCVTDEDLEYFVRECGEILGVTSALEEEQSGQDDTKARDSKHILRYIFERLVEYKKLNQEQIVMPEGDVDGKGPSASSTVNNES